MDGILFIHLILSLVPCIASPWDPLVSSSNRSPVRRQYDFYEVEIDPDKHNLDFFDFVTRPDILAPRWNIKIYKAEALSPGYWFLAPYLTVEQEQHDRAYEGPHIYDQTGDLVWSGAPTLGNYAGFDFKVSRVFNQDMLTMISLFASGALILDQHYDTYKLIQMGPTPGLTNIHGFSTIHQGKKALYITREIRNATLQNSLSVGFKGHCNTLFTGFHELDLATGENLFTWTPEDHVGLNESTISKIMPGECEDIPWDYFHANSIERLPDGDYLLSAHNTYALYKISHKDGTILWRLGGKKSDFEWIGEGLFAGQHDARCHMQNETHMLISIFDNANGPGEPRISYDFSRGILVSLRTDTDPMTAQVVKSYDHPWENHVPARGNFQVLSNGNAFLGWSRWSLHSEHAADGELIMEAHLTSRMKTYRSYKLSWIGLPKLPPDVNSTVVAIGDSQTVMTIVHVSWNGATEVATWDLYTKHGNGSSQLLASERRRGFETAITHNGYAECVFVEALAVNGSVLGRSGDVISTIAGPVDTTLHPSIVSELQKQQGDAQMAWTGVEVSWIRTSSLAFGGGVVLCMILMLSLRNGCRWKQSLYAPLSNVDED